MQNTSWTNNKVAASIFSIVNPQYTSQYLDHLQIVYIQMESILLILRIWPMARMLCKLQQMKIFLWISLINFYNGNYIQDDNDLTTDNSTINIYVAPLSNDYKTYYCSTDCDYVDVDLGRAPVTRVRKFLLNKVTTDKSIYRPHAACFQQLA